MLRQRTYNVLNDVKVGFAFASMVSPPSANPDGKPHITWSRFHKVSQLQQRTSVHDPLTQSTSNFRACMRIRG